MRWWLPVVCAVAGCFAPTAPAGAPCSAANTACPGDQVCTATPAGFTCLPPGALAIDANPAIDSVDADPDGDHDGIANALDNCPAIANADQANDDGDRFGDACDPCPPIADPDPIVDPDSDGVSGACDPFPATPGDAIRVFESFTAPALPAGWATIGSGWTFAGGSAVIDSGSDDLNYLTIAQPAATRQAVITQLTVDELVGGNERAIGPVQLFQASPTRSIACELLRDGNGPKLAIDDTGGPTLDTTDATFDPDLTVTLTNRRDGTSYQCEDGEVIATGSSAFATPQPGIGLRTRSVSGRFAWVLVVAAP
jgi:hypothetical protein